MSNSTWKKILLNKVLWMALIENRILVTSQVSCLKLLKLCNAYFQNDHLHLHNEKCLNLKSLRQNRLCLSQFPALITQITSAVLTIGKKEKPTLCSKYNKVLVTKFVKHEYSYYLVWFVYIVFCLKIHEIMCLDLLHTNLTHATNLHLYLSKSFLLFHSKVSWRKLRIYCTQTMLWLESTKPFYLKV
jgi:hypothetical protein